MLEIRLMRHSERDHSGHGNDSGSGQKGTWGGRGAHGGVRLCGFDALGDSAGGTLLQFTAGGAKVVHLVVAQSRASLYGRRRSGS